MRNEVSLDTICAALTYGMGIEAPECAAAPNAALCEYIDKMLGNDRLDRIFMYNPDAIGQWVMEKHPFFCEHVKALTDVAIPLETADPPKTPVCFATMYTGAQPSVHGIEEYTRPVIKIDTIFDALIRSGKKGVIVCTEGDSLAKIYLEREMDYFFYPTTEEVSAKAAEVVLEDKYDFVVMYNAGYDSVMHACGPESPEALAELRGNSELFAMFAHLIKSKWKQHNTLIGFAMDHGSHTTSSGKGNHNLEIDEDMSIVHSYKIFKKEI